MILKMRSEKGTILIASLWILAILTILATGFAYRMSLELKLTGYRIAKLKALCLAKAGVTCAISVLESEKGKEFCALNQPWSNNPETFGEIGIGEGTFSVSHRPVDCDFREIAYGAVDEERKININFASSKMLESLPGINSEIAAGIVDWRDKDNRPVPNGAEDSYYQTLSNPYRCKNGEFELVEELLWVKGVTPSLLTEIGDLITVYGDGRVNINTCEKEVLAALGLGENLIQEIIHYRRGADNLDGTPDDNIFQKVETIVERLSSSRSLAPGELKQLSVILARDLVCISSNYFRINSIGSLEDGKVAQRICAVVKVEKDKPTRVVYWQEG